MNLKSEVALYQQEGKKHLQKIEKFYKSISIEDALQNSACGIDPNGRMNEHQYLVGKILCQKGADYLNKSFKEIQDNPRPFQRKRKGRAKYI